MAADFANEKATFLRFAYTLKKAQSPAQLLDLLQADVTAPYHVFDLDWVAGIPENIGTGLAELMGDAVAEKLKGLPRDE